MNKSTIEYFREENHIKGYSTFTHLHAKKNLPDETDILNAIVEFMQNKGGHKVYRHILREEFHENIPKYGMYEVRTPNVPSCDIPKGDQVYYIDIYWQ